MMLKGQHPRSNMRVATWRHGTSFGLACLSAPTLGVNLPGYVNLIGSTKSAEQCFSDRSRRQN